jgi:hypothetical protein
MTEDELRNIIRSKIKWDVTTKSLAQEWGLPESYLSDVLNAERGIGHKLANALGYRRVVTFERQKTERSSHD